MVLVDPGLHDRIDRAGFLAEAAVDALEQVDVVARRAARAVRADVGLDGDRQCRADGLAELARNAALLAIGVPAQRVQAAIAERLRGLLFRILHRELGREERPQRDLQALQQFPEEECLDDAAHALATSRGPRPDLVDPEHRLDAQPDQRDRDEHLPAEAHDLSNIILRVRYIIRDQKD